MKLIQYLVRYARSQPAVRQARELRARAAAASTYEEWFDAARALDELEGRRPPESIMADGIRGLQKRTLNLERMRKANETHSLMWAVREDTSRNVGALMGSAAEEGKVHCLIPPAAVERYVEEMQRALHHICHCDALGIEERLAFVREVRHAFGRTGLVLSGGGSFGHFHFGVTRALLFAGLLPRVCSGSSAGSIGCAMLCTRTDAELKATIDMWINHKDTDFFGAPKSAGGMIRHLVTHGTLHAAEEYVQRLQRLFGDFTFQEAFAHTGRVLNIAVVAADTREPCRLLNYLTAPHVLVWSAVACSSAFPLLFAPQELLAKDAAGRLVPHGTCAGVSVAGASLRRWCDGSLEEDLPMRGLSEMFNINYFLVSQCNPYLVPLLAFRRLFPRWLQRMGEMEFKHRVGQLLLIWPHSRLFKLLCQPWDGDLNFVLPMSAFPLLRSAVNFTPQEITKAMHEVRSAGVCIGAINNLQIHPESTTVPQTGCL